jgi:hypothetical protein
MKQIKSIASRVKDNQIVAIEVKSIKQGTIVLKRNSMQLRKLHLEKILPKKNRRYPKGKQDR